MKKIPIDDRRSVVVPGDAESTYEFVISHLIALAKKEIAEKGFFSLALSGGSTPKELYRRLATSKERSQIDWQKVFIFFSDERAVAPTHPNSNYRMAFEEGNLSSLPLAMNNVHRMKAEEAIEENALAYENQIKEKIHSSSLDCVLLGVGEDGHTASLFPHNEALFVVNRLVISTFVDEKRGQRMTFSFQAINQSKAIIVLALGKRKSELMGKLFTAPYDPDELPAQRLGSLSSPALFVLDEEASANLAIHLK